MRPPHLTAFARQPLVFLTACTRDRSALLAQPSAYDALVSVWSQSADRQGWVVGRFVIMPDHVHLFARPQPNSVTLGKWIKAWKCLSARALSRTAGRTSALWQTDYFDHFLRCAESYSEKWDYVRHNPVRAGLVARADDWPWQGEINELRF
jgi:REP element-mobilizing transposase RayT